MMLWDISLHGMLPVAYTKYSTTLKSFIVLWYLPDFSLALKASSIAPLCRNKKFLKKGCGVGVSRRHGASEREA